MTEKALIVLTQDNIDTAIHAIEKVSIHMDNKEFIEQYGEVYKKLHSIERDSGNSYRVK